jgi:hypothetical protein
MALIKEAPIASQIASLWPHYERGCVQWALDAPSPLPVLLEGLAYIASEVKKDG